MNIKIYVKRKIEAVIAAMRQSRYFNSLFLIFDLYKVFYDSERTN